MILSRMAKIRFNLILAARGAYVNLLARLLCEIAHGLILIYASALSAFTAGRALCIAWCQDLSPDLIT